MFFQYHHFSFKYYCNCAFRTSAFCTDIINYSFTQQILIELPIWYQEMSFKRRIASLSLPFPIALLFKTIVIFQIAFFICPKK